LAFDCRQRHIELLHQVRRRNIALEDTVRHDKLHGLDFLETRHGLEEERTERAIVLLHHELVQNLEREFLQQLIETSASQLGSEQAKNDERKFEEKERRKTKKEGKIREERKDSTKSARSKTYHCFALISKFRWNQFIQNWIFGQMFPIFKLERHIRFVVHFSESE
jgi:hypothetical protein